MTNVIRFVKNAHIHSENWMIHDNINKQYVTNDSIDPFNISV